MKIPTIPSNETERLQALKEYSILDTIPEEEYDDITYLASQICQTPISLISLIDADRQWFKSKVGLDATETPRDIAFCAHAINRQESIMVVPDSRKDDRFFDNPLVTADPHVIFYAGVPLVNKDGCALGTLCVIDSKPKELNEHQLRALKGLSNQIIALFELRRNQHRLESLNYELKAQNQALTRFAHITAHDLKSPLSNVIMLADLLDSGYVTLSEADRRESIRLIRSSSDDLLQLIDGILRHSKETHLLSSERETVVLNDLVRKVINLVDVNRKAKYSLPLEKHKLYINKVALEQILINLIANGIKYNDKDEVRIVIHAEETPELIRISIRDNGPGIREEDKERIFQLFETTSVKDREGNTGTGIGLSTVKTLVEGLGGTIRVSSTVGRGATFEFTLRK